MSRLAKAVLGLGALGAVCLIGLGRIPARAASDDEVEHGRYIVRQVAMCIDCHGTALTGGHVGHGPLAPVVPAIAGLPGRDVATVAHFLETGDMSGTTLPPPMPSYRMHADDAHAVAVYLHSLPTAAPSPAPSPT